MVDYTENALSMPCDEELLAPLGRVAWAALRLHHGVRDAINTIEGTPSDAPFEQTLGQAVGRLRDLATHHAVEPARTAVLSWYNDTASPAVESRNGVLHAIGYTDPDGRQALRGSSIDRPARYLTTELLQAAGHLIEASRTLPQGPYT